MTPGQKFRAAVVAQQPLQCVGTINAYSAILARDAGHHAIYLSGAGVANASYALPDLAITQRSDVLTDACRITQACDLPLLVDADTGWGHELCIARTVKEFINADVAGMHIEDQHAMKRCGHRPDKSIVSQQEMCDRIKACVDARTCDDFVIMARTDAIQCEGITAAIDRISAYVEAGADMIFPEAISSLENYQTISAACSQPILANITEFGRTPLFDVNELAAAGVSIVLYPLSAFRAMNAAAQKVYDVIRSEGSQKSLLDDMQTREQLYASLDYYRYEAQMDIQIQQRKDESDDK